MWGLRKNRRNIGQRAARNNLKNGNPNETQDKLCCQRGYKINEGQAPSSFGAWVVWWIVACVCVRLGGVVRWWLEDLRS